jgi:hypothetical protein
MQSNIPVKFAMKGGDKRTVNDEGAEKKLEPE